MIDWLARAPSEPEIELDGQARPIVIRRHPTARRLTLRLAADGSEVRLTIPRWCPERDAIAFAHARREWLAGQLARIPARQAPAPGGMVSYRGRELALDWQMRAPRRPRIAGETIQLGGPEAGMARRLQRWLEHEAMRLLADDLAHYCDRAGQSVPQLRLSRAQRRWGSCSSQGIVRINWRLVQAPDFVRRSVVAHEVTHLVHFDHSPAFHALLAQLFEGNLPAADRWLKREGRTLYSAFG
ncbi:MAG: M48 family metallopeptidase [Sphingomonadales bacterium]|nr:M48 family metallopeptidase [Sphingomonadales bacterium]MBD3774133.1 M48 family metallopeptidase [Paracoccaceae bacterium]